MMSPKTKKILMIGGAAVAGFIVYKMIKKPAHTAPVALPTQKASMLSKIASAQITKIGGIEEELGVSEDLGSLGSSWR